MASPVPRRVRTLLLIASIAALTAGGALPAAAAAPAQVVIGGPSSDDDLGGGFEREVLSGVPDAWSSSDCDTGALPGKTDDRYDEHRLAYEFPLSELPGGAQVISASLAVSTLRHDLAGQTAIYGYAGDGTITSADVDVTGTPVLFTPASSSDDDIVEVTDLLTADVISSGWAGFSLRQEPLGDTRTNWGCNGTNRDPYLTITYSLPDAQPDARIKRSGGKVQGNDIYNTTGAGQSVYLTPRAGTVRRIYVTIQNDGPDADAFSLEVTGNVPAGYNIRYFRGRSNQELTSAVNAGTLTTPTLAPGQMYRIRVVVRTTSAAAKGSLARRLFTFTSEANSTASDAALLWVKRR
jgi:hypothetical protein